MNKGALSRIIRDLTNAGDLSVARALSKHEDLLEDVVRKAREGKLHDFKAWEDLGVTHGLRTAYTDYVQAAMGSKNLTEAQADIAFYNALGRDFSPRNQNRKLMSELIRGDGANAAPAPVAPAAARHVDATPQRARTPEPKPEPEVKAPKPDENESGKGNSLQDMGLKKIPRTVDEVRDKQIELALELESVMAAPKQKTGIIQNFLKMRTAQATHLPPSNAIETANHRSIADVLKDLRELRSEPNYKGLKPEQAVEESLSPQQTLNALADGQWVSNESFRKFNEKASTGKISTVSFVRRHPWTAAGALLTGLYATGSVYDFYFKDDLSSTPVIAQLPLNTAIEWADKSLNKPGYEDYPPQVDWEIKHAENNPSYRNKLIALAYNQMTPEEQVRVSEHIKKYIDQIPSVYNFKDANDYQRSAGKVFIERLVTDAAETTKGVETAKAGAIKAEASKILSSKEKTEASSAVATPFSPALIGREYVTQQPAPATQTAPPVMPAAQAPEKAINGAQFNQKLTELVQEQTLDKNTSSQLAKVWSDSTKMAVAGNEELTAKNLLQKDEFPVFSKNAQDILVKAGVPGATAQQIVQYLTEPSM